MSESTLSINLHGLRADIAYFLGKGRDSTNWSSDDVAIFDSHIRAGLRLFYNPLRHVWSFFKPFSSVVMAANAKEAQLPDDFGFIIGDVIISESGNTSKWKARQVSCNEIESQDASVKGKPLYYCISPVAAGETGQRFKISVYPAADKQYTISYQYSVVPKAISDLEPYPYGGEAHAETIREACLAKAEEDTEDGSIGIHAQNYQERLAASIAYDKNLMTPDNLGYNGNGSRFFAPVRDIEIKINGITR